MSRLPKNHFWKWFKLHNKEYFSLQTKPKKEAEYWFDELNAHLKAHLRFFEFDILLNDKTEPDLTLIISVSGRAKYFKRADAFVARAPALEGWKIKALHDPMPNNFLLGELIEETGIDPSELFFSLHDNNGGRAHILIFHPLCTEKNRKSLRRLACWTIYLLVGERSFGNDIDHIDVDNLSDAEDEGLKKLDELPDCIRLRQSSIIIDETGKLQEL